MDIQNNNQNNFYTPYKPPEKKVLFNFTQADLIFSILFIVSAYLIVDLGVCGLFNLGFTISYFILFAITSIYLFNKNSKPSFFTLACGAVSLASSVSLSLSNDFTVNCFSLILIALLFCTYVCGISKTFKHNTGSYKLGFDLFSSVAIMPFSNAGEVATSFSKSYSKNKGLKNALVGILVALPVLIIIVPLLIKSDQAFESLVGSVAENVGTFLLKLVFSLLLGAYLIFYTVSKKYHDKLETDANPKTSKYKGSVAASAGVSFLSVISLVYIVYLFSQLAYFFSAFSGILPRDYKFSASVYARRGFFEMFAVCVINMIIIAAANILVKRNKDGKIPVGIKSLSAFIMAFTVLMLVTAMQKMKLNIGVYGMSENRILVCVFMIMILIIVAFYILHIFVPKFNYMQPIIILCSAIFVVLSFANINSFVVDYNIKAYENGRIEDLDVNYIADSGANAEYLCSLTKSGDRKIAHEARELYASELENVNEKLLKSLATSKDYKTDFTDADSIGFKSYNFAQQNYKQSLLDSYNSLTPAERQKILVQYSLDSNGDYTYFENDDVYVDYNNYCYVFNKSSDKYEYNGKLSDDKVNELYETSNM